VKVNDGDELRQHIQTVWDELDQHIIDKVIKQWRTQCKLALRPKVTTLSTNFKD